VLRKLELCSHLITGLSLQQFVITEFNLVVEADGNDTFLAI